MHTRLHDINWRDKLAKASLAHPVTPLAHPVAPYVYGVKFFIAHQNEKKPNKQIKYY